MTAITRPSRRRHRRVRRSWAGCLCPSNAQIVRTPGVTRGWACIADTAQGPRFVRALCQDVPARALPPPRRAVADEWEGEVVHVRTTPAPARQLLLPASTATSSPTTSKPKKKRSKRTVDWGKCKCPSGSELKATKRGKACVKRSAKGALRFVAADCP